MRHSRSIGGTGPVPSPGTTGWRGVVVPGAVALLALLIGACRPGRPRIDPARFHVSPSGNDAWSGAFADPSPDGSDGPFATLERARDEIRKRGGATSFAAPVTVEVRGGIYRLAGTFELRAEDSGTPTAPVTYRAREGERPTLSGDGGAGRARALIAFGPGTAHVAIVGFLLERCAGSAVAMRDTERCLVAGCIIRDASGPDGCGIAIVEGNQNGADGNDIHDVGRDAIAISGGDRIMLVRGENRAENNHIHHVGTADPRGVGIALSGCGNRATRNLIHHCPGPAIAFAGNDLLIEGNVVHHAAVRVPDTGALLTDGRDWLGSRGSVVRHNLIRDIPGAPAEGAPHPAWGILLDDHASGVDVVGNIVARASGGAILLRGARDNLIENNILLDGALAQIECDGWTRSDPRWLGVLPRLIAGHESIAHRQEWRGMRNIQIRPHDVPLPDGTIMSGNVFRRNLLSYRAPDAALFRFRHFSLQHNRFDENLVFHYGAPLLTGQSRVKEVIGDNLLSNPGFEDASADGTLAGWSWRPGEGDARALREADLTNLERHSLRVEPGRRSPGDAGPSSLSSGPIQIRALRAYRLAARLRAARPGAPVALVARSGEGAGQPWTTSQRVTVDTSWQQADMVFRTPATGTAIHAQIDLPPREGALWIDDVRLEEVALLDEWESWRAAGMDSRSLAADPLLVDPDADDYRLSPESPAFQLGFTPIPQGRMGLYQSATRATWPIVEPGDGEGAAPAAR